MKQKKIAALLLVSTMTVGLLGSTVSVSADSGESLTLWMPTFADAEGEVTDEEFWQEKADAFGEAHDCTVSVEIVPWDSYEEKYLAGTSSNDGPDVGYMYMEMFYDYIDNGMLVDVDSYFTDEEKENYLYYDLGNLLGGQYALPVVVGNPRIFVANKSILEEAGIEAMPTTIDELIEDLRIVQEKCPDVTPLATEWGNTHYGSLNELFWPYFWSNGGEIIDADGNLTIDSDAGVKTAQMLLDLANEGLLGDSPTSNDDALATFKAGNTAFACLASSNVLKVTDFEWDYVPVLDGDTDGSTFVAADSLVMFESCENKELAAELMKYITSAEVMSDFHQRVSDQPPITKDEEYSGSEIFENLFTENSDSFQSLPVFKAASSMYDTLFKNLQSMMLGDLTPEEALTETTDYYNNSLI